MIVQIKNLAEACTGRFNDGHPYCALGQGLAPQCARCPEDRDESEAQRAAVACSESHKL